MSNDDLHLKYRRQNESEREWRLRRLFIERHADKYAEDRLLCLAQCFVNIQTMGCRYSYKIMNQIKELTADIEPLIQERKTTIVKQRPQQQQQPQQLQREQTNKQQLSFTQQPKQPKSQETMKQKLISKTHLVNDNEIQFQNQTPKSKIQILTRNKTTPQSTSTPSSTTTTTVSYKNAVLNSLISTPQQSTPAKPLKSVPSTPSVPATTTELAPAASTLPIPFGLSPNTNSRNFLLNMLKIEANNSTQKPNDPLSILIGPCVTQSDTKPCEDDIKFVRLNKINKLREVLRSNKVLFVENYELIEFFDKTCMENNVEVKYEPVFENELYFGELFIESFRLVNEQHKKKKKCKYYTYKKAYDILVGRAELAVKLANNQNGQNFEYELYILDASFEHETTTSQENMNSLNSLLKLMNLPKDNGTNESTLNDDSKESQMELDEDNDDDDDDAKSHGMNKKAKIKQNLTNFCLFIPSFNLNEHIDLANIDQYIHERNSLQIIHQSCVKSSCNLEFEIKIKSQLGQVPSKSVKTKISGDRIQVESDEETLDPNDPKKFKCKCLINGVKITSASATNKNDSKRLAALKAIKYLLKMFPVIKETSYQTINNSSSTLTTTSAAPTPKYFKITKEELFGGLAPPTYFEATSLDNCLKASSLPHQTLGTANCL